MRHIFVDVHEKIATPQGNALYICGNSDYIIRFGFDAEWNEYDKKTDQPIRRMVRRKKAWQSNKRLANTALFRMIM